MARMSKKPTANQPDLTLTAIAERLGCEPDAEAICVAIERLKRKAKRKPSPPPSQIAGDVKEWQPIETAPKDGTNVLVCREMEDRSVGEAFFWEGAWRTWDGENHTRTSWIEGYLTHWRPMPGAFPAPTNRRIEMARMMFKQERVPPMSEGVPMTDTESKVLRDFLTSPLSVDDAVRRLVSLGYQEAVAEDLVEEWIEGAHSKEGI